MKEDRAKFVLVDAFENLAVRIHNEEKKEGVASGLSKHKQDERRKAIEAIRENIELFRMNL